MNGDAPPVWDRQRDSEGKLEPLLWFRRFEAYRLMKPTRTVMDVYRSYLAGKGRQERAKKVRRIPGAWHQAKTKWDWKARAEAYDEYVIDTERQRVEAELEENRELARQTRLQLIQAVQDIATRAIYPYIQPDGGKQLSVNMANEISLLIKRTNSELRAEYGDDHPIMHEITGKGGGKIEVELGTTDDIRAAILGRISKLVTGSGSDRIPGESDAEGTDPPTT